MYVRKYAATLFLCDINMCFTRQCTVSETLLSKNHFHVLDVVFGQENLLKKLLSEKTFKPAHDKPTKWHVRPAKTQVSLGIRPV